MKHGSLKLVIERYKRLRDDAAAAQARVQMEMDGARRTMQTLEQYRSEQHQRVRDSQCRALSTTLLLLQTRFSGKLDEAIALQAERIAALGERIEACRARVLACQQRLKAVESIEERRAMLARRKAERAEQFTTDEHAADAHMRHLREATETQARQALHATTQDLR